MKMINLTIDGCMVQGREGQTILTAARGAGMFIPSLCYEEAIPPQGACGICIVETNGRRLRACATPIAEGMEVNTKSQRVLDARKALLELQLSDHTGDCKAPCQLACPAYTDCQGYIALIAQGRLEEAQRRMMAAHPFPASIARVCPRPCESKCRRGEHDEAINIAGLKRYAADGIGPSHVPEPWHSTGMSVAIVGGGPAGLTAAYFLRQVGHSVDVFDHMPKMGGLLRYGIPEYRLPKAVLDKELDVLTRMDIRFNNGVKLGGEGADINLESLQQRYNAVIIAIGAGLSRPMGIPGEDLPGVAGGIDFLRSPSPIQGQKIIVIGGSNTAIDAARTALRLGAESVTVAYRRTKDEMPAEPIEIEEAEEEGVVFKFLVAPIEITQENQRANGINLQIMALGEPDASGRRSPKPIPGQEEWLPADTIIAAIGQAVDLDGLEDFETKWQALKADPVTFTTNQPGVFAIGDATGQSAYAIEAIGHGRKAAEAVHGYLYKCRGGSLPPAVSWDTLPNVLVSEENLPHHFADTPKAPREANPKKEAPLGFEEVHQNFTAEQAAKEAARCLSCGCADYHECKLIDFASLYKADPAKFKGCKKNQHPINHGNPVVVYDPNKCVTCGLCVKVCEQDRAVLTMAHRGFGTTVVPHGQSTCAQCGKCAEMCPVGARVKRAITK